MEPPHPERAPHLRFGVVDLGGPTESLTGCPFSVSSCTQEVQELTENRSGHYGHDMPTVAEEEMLALVGHRFPGGTRTIEHWENWLLTDCTGRDQLPDGLVHPIALFHVPIQGVGTSISELFALGQVDGAGSVGLDGYDWEYFQPLRENVEYRFDGGVIEVERKRDDRGNTFDRFVFSIELSTPDGQPAARITNHWRLRR